MCAVLSSQNVALLVQAAVDAADVACGLSLGEYTALTYAKAIRSGTSVSVIFWLDLYSVTLDWSVRQPAGSSDHIVLAVSKMV